MADKKITELTTYSPPVDNDVLPIVDTTLGVTMKITWANIKAALKTYFDSLTTTLTNKTLTSPVLTTPQINDTSADHQYITAVSELTADRTVTLPLLTGNDEFVFKDHAQTLTNKTLSTGSKLDANADSNFTYNSLSRQAIINGNFDVWQRGTSTTMTGVWSGGTFFSDRWRVTGNPDSGTPPTSVLSRQILTSGDIPNAFYYARLNVNGAGTSFGADSLLYYAQRIEHGTRFLCGDGKKVTVSFWAKSDITDKKLGINLYQGYGSTGSPSSEETINGISWTLTSTWTKYTHTFTTNTLASKTFGTDNNDVLIFSFNFVWGSSKAAISGTTGAETFVGSGNIDIAQVQLCAGDVALPFMPKSFEEELRACQRYYEKSYKYTDAPGTTQAGNETGLVTGIGHANNIIVCSIDFCVRKRIIPTTTTLYKYAGTVAKISNFNANDEVGTSVTINGVTEKGIFRILDSGTGFTAGNRYWFCWTAEAEL